MRLRAEPPRVTRLSRKVLAGIGARRSLGIGGALIYALADASTTARQAGALFDRQQSTRRWPRRPADATIPAFRSSGHRFPAISAARSSTRRTAASRAVDRPRRHRTLSEQRRRAGAGGGAGPRVCSRPRKRGPRVTATALAATDTPPQTDLAGLGLAPQPATPSAQDRQLAFLECSRRPAHRRAGSRHGAGVALRAAGGRRHPGRAHHRHPLRPARPDHRAGDGKCL